MFLAALLLAATVHSDDVNRPFHSLRPSSPACTTHVRVIESEAVERAVVQLAPHREQIVLRDDGQTAVVMVVNTAPNCSYAS